MCSQVSFGDGVVLAHWNKRPLLNRLIKIEATVNWACYGGVSVRGIFMRDVWPGVKLGNVHDNAKSQEALQGLKVPHTRGGKSFFHL